GLTIGHAAACVLVRAQPWPGGGVRLLRVDTHSSPKHWELCQVPIDGIFVSSSVELMRLGKLIPPLLERDLAAVGWSPADVDPFVFHQPSEGMVRRILEDLGADPARGIYSHALYGNNASASVGVAFQRLLAERNVRRGDKIVLGSAAAGFSVV